MSSFSKYINDSVEMFGRQNFKFPLYNNEPLYSVMDRMGSEAPQGIIQALLFPTPILTRRAEW